VCQPHDAGKVLTPIVVARVAEVWRLLAPNPTPSRTTYTYKAVLACHSMQHQQTRRQHQRHEPIVLRGSTRSASQPPPPYPKP
jgi:hypothetical protein